jgi:signal transduction histidine kinase
MTEYGYALIGFTAVVGAVIGFVTFALLRLGAGIRDAGRHLQSGSGAETAFLAAALQDAVSKLRAQERAMSERAEASEALSGQIVASLTAGLLVADVAGRVRILNPAGRRLLDIQGEPVGQEIHAALASVPPLAAAVAECLASGEPIVRRALAMPPGSRATHVGVTVSPFASGGERDGVICLFSDLTAVYDLEEQLRLKETLARLGEMTAGIAHEFRNGLATIHGYSRLFDRSALPVREQEFIDAIRQETESLGQIVTNFLNFARPEQPELTRVDVGTLVRRVVEDVRPEMASGGAISVGGHYPEIDGDEVLVRQAFVNLLRNGLEAATSIDRTPEMVVTGEIDDARGRCRIFFDDNGPGVPLAERERIFRPFFTTRSRGTGLGLAIVQKIALVHNGRVRVGVAPTGGARFEIELPCTGSSIRSQA